MMSETTSGSINRPLEDNARHRLSPSYLNHRANIDALRRAGVTDVLRISAVAPSAPVAFVAVDQFISRTFAFEGLQRCGLCLLGI
jgi:purine nucleoside phosphorylase